MAPKAIKFSFKSCECENTCYWQSRVSDEGDLSVPVRDSLQPIAYFLNNVEFTH